ncbi:hypothetical protein GCM10017608_35930 [Agromyces luteolus]|uniref:DUF2530 domain-containing protein n=1 Tax=Agromyces luteolus TaxID=88373 RepID=A0A7C9LW31_9MICO|nr:DUF2530 domain-containing protein [Agromyces luteolus]MUN07199.1 DUF2530 domain-containing protein [Agromyces luteolus]GLK29655.1 hypothetical protein GCM10017608_35930 [Agromyces luteolus]
MRLWLSESERRPDPEPVRADARKALLAGTVGWVVALALALAFSGALADAGFGWFTIAAAIGVVLGIVGLVVVQLRRRRHPPEPDDRASR